MISPGLHKLHQNFRTKEQLENEIKNLKWKVNAISFLFVIILLMFIANLYETNIREDNLYKIMNINTYNETIILNNCRLNMIYPEKVSVWCDGINEYYGKPLGA